MKLIIIYYNDDDDDDDEDEDEDEDEDDEEEEDDDDDDDVWPTVITNSVPSTLRALWPNPYRAMVHAQKMAFEGHWSELKDHQE